jgi:putative FmdB family regulatory protein
VPADAQTVHAGGPPGAAAQRAEFGYNTPLSRSPEISPMPIYEYRCESCGAEVEKLQKISDPPLKDCPSCGKAALAKRVSATSFRLKGSGWYETDFKTGKKKALADAGGDSSAAGSSAGTGGEGSAGSSTGGDSAGAAKATGGA